ncbi:AMP-binding protein [Variovorax guangxiensis]|uniref:class I adenylate-forming enzyme family protein n=1 Tax=Variovorax guangxiensis TaxID=1775474 RepID=UPI00285BDF02|nr:AMP-binding protein [Variovorax guangxiensis]MDR6861542.1 acyl-CoA synthetase (AMP-forming)/AMP-acid ligase II [Variovorax guangxiensis]
MFPIDFLRHAALATPDAIAVVDGVRTCTYAALVERCEALAAGLQATTGKHRPTVALLGPNSIEMLVALMAVHAGGAVLVPLNGRNAKGELDAQIRRVRPDVLVVHKAYLDMFTPIEKVVVVADADSGDPRAMALLEAGYRGQRANWQAELGDMNAIKFTGGSSGVPKGVMQSFRSLNTLVSSVVMAFEFDASDRYLCVAPMTHGAGALLLPTLARGGCIILTSDAKPPLVLDLMERERTTSTWMPPTMLYGLIDEQKARPRDLRGLTHLIWGGAAASPARLREAQEVFGPVIETVFGQTEAPLILSFGRAWDLVGDKRINSVGRVGPLADVAVLDPSGRRLEANQLGEICARGDLLMNGYFEMENETASTIRNGWLHTGDIGLIDEAGFLYLKDRIRDVVISGGFNVYPSDVEAAIAQHPAVSEVVVFGVPDDYWGERVEAALELRAGHSATPEQLITFCKDVVGSVKSPKRIHIVETLPRSPVGKVLRREARVEALTRNTALETNA